VRTMDFSQNCSNIVKDVQHVRPLHVYSRCGLHVVRCKHRSCVRNQYMSSKGIKSSRQTRLQALCMERHFCSWCQWFQDSNHSWTVHLERQYNQVPSNDRHLPGFHPRNFD
jgi:hypothetical protein